VAWTRISHGAFVTGYNATITPTAPAGFSAGHTLIVATGCYAGSNTIPTPSGWTKCTLDSAIHQVQVFAKHAAGGDAMPAISWGNQFAWAKALAYSGGPADLTNIVHVATERGATSADDIALPAATISAPNCLVLAIGQKNKTTASNSSTFSATTNFTMVGQNVGSGTNTAEIVQEWIQTPATSVSLASAAGSVADATVQTTRGVVIALLPAGSSATIAPSVGALTLTGLQPVRLQQGAAGPATGSLTLSGRPAWVSVSDGPTLIVSAPAGPYEDESIFDVDTTVGNVAVVDRVASPSGIALSFPSGGLPVLASPVTGRQSFTWKEWSYITGAWVPVEGGDTATYYLNNEPPLEVVAIDDQLWHTAIPIDPIILGDYVNDGDDVESTLSYSGTLPDGLSIETAVYNEGEPSERAVKQIQGTPTTQGSGTITLTVTDVPGQTDVLTAFDYVVDDAVQMPFVEEGITSYTDAITAVQAVGLEILSVTPVIDGSVTLGNVISSLPAGGTYLPRGSLIGLVVSGIEMPDLIGMTFADANSALVALGLVAVQVDQAAPEGTHDLVYSQSDEAGTAVLPSNSEYLFINTHIARVSYRLVL
jgi:hypothetical protein